MPSQKSLILVVALVIIGGSIALLESTKRVQPPSDEDVVELIPVYENDNTSDPASTVPATTSSNTSHEMPRDKLPMGEPVVQEMPKPQAQKPNLVAILSAKEGKYQRAVEIANPSGFINTEPIKLADYVGKKVILVDFWTYSCINCQRTLPYLTSWDIKYKDEGLLVVGIHTPEFQFEEKRENVVRATEKFGVRYPVVMDNDYGTWHAYKNRYWPRKYLIDIDGFIVYDHIGEGAYAATEEKIQELLQERKERLGETGKVTNDLTLPDENFFPVSFGKSPETYFGAQRNYNFGNGIPGERGEKTFSIPDLIITDILYLVGKWNVADEYAANTGGTSKIIFKYTSSEVNFVAEADSATEVEILLDGVSVDAKRAGKEIIFRDGKSFVSIKDADLYNLVKTEKFETHTIEIIPQKTGLRAFTFTF